MKPAHLAACYALCKRYDITIVPTEQDQFPSAAFTAAPAGYLCDLATNSILVPADYSWQTHVDNHSPEYGFEAFLHEAMHLIMQPPFATITELPERWVLMQVEVSIARALVDKEGVDLVTAWQRYTLTGTGGEGNSDDGRFIHWQQGYWKEGYRLARKVGVLDCGNRPTWHWPNWRRLSKRERESWRELTAATWGDGVMVTT